MRYNVVDLSLYYILIGSVKARKFWFHQLLTKSISYDHDLKETNLFSAVQLHLQGAKRLDFSTGFEACQLKKELVFSLPHIFPV